MRSVRQDRPRLEQGTSQVHNMLSIALLLKMVAMWQDAATTPKVEPRLVISVLVAVI